VFDSKLNQSIQRDLESQGDSACSVPLEVLYIPNENVDTNSERQLGILLKDDPNRS
jgi:hypothetical protein